MSESGAALYGPVLLPTANGKTTGFGNWVFHADARGHNFARTWGASREVTQERTTQTPLTGQMHHPANSVSQRLEPWSSMTATLWSNNTVCSELSSELDPHRPQRVPWLCNSAGKLGMTKALSLYVLGRCLSLTPINFDASERKPLQHTPPPKNSVSIGLHKSSPLYLREVQLHKALCLCLWPNTQFQVRTTEFSIHKHTFTDPHTPPPFTMRASPKRYASSTLQDPTCAVLVLYGGIQATFLEECDPGNRAPPCVDQSKEGVSCPPPLPPTHT